MLISKQKKKTNHHSGLASLYHWLYFMGKVYGRKIFTYDMDIICLAIQFVTYTFVSHKGNCPQQIVVSACATFTTNDICNRLR